ncbi:MAG: ABC transporter substrate-binding protein [Lachnospiraceae bacterium]|nr:ABC transporter substrate-binding protein [Lachnospiraceae bacterium]
MQKKICEILISCILFVALSVLSACDTPSSHSTVITIPVPTEDNTVAENPAVRDFADLKFEKSLETKYAIGFSADYYEGGVVLLNVFEDGSKYLIVPEGMEITADDEYIIIKRPLENIYLVSSSSMDMFVGIDALDSIKFSGKEADDWYIKEAADAMNEGKIVYAGKYSKPDYELIVSGECRLVIENTMIYHSPDVLEQFKTFGIPVIVDYSSYEEHPLGRVEWIKFYGALFGEEEKAEAIFKEQEDIVENVKNTNRSDKTIAYFYITSNNLVQVKKSSDYVPKMIEIAGAKYIFEDLNDDNGKKTTVNMQIEEFYKTAKDADIIIYNSSIDGGMETLDDLFAKCDLIKDFKAVENDEVWCTTNDMYQQSLSAGYMIEDINAIVNGEYDKLHYMFRLR